MAQTEAITTAREQSTQTIETQADAAANTAEGSQDAASTRSKKRRSKYRHVAAYHSQSRHSSLSRESDETISFLGFRNLMVLVLGEYTVYSFCDAGSSG